MLTPSRARSAFATWGRMAVTVVALLAQLALLAVVIVFFRNLSPWLITAQLVLALVVMVGIIGSDMTTEYKLAWTIPLFIAPVFGAVFYLLYGARPLSRYQKAQMIAARTATSRALAEYRSAPPGSEQISRESSYLDNAGYPVTSGNAVEYFPLGELGFEKMLADLETAERYIFFEYFIVSAGTMWDQIHEVLARKAAAGVEVRVLYDDVGSHFTLPARFHETLTASGIHVQAVNPLGARLSVKYNNRDHRKILVIDGRVAFTGGINIADEYINVVHPYGHWKDVVVRMEGPAAWNFAAIFLAMWSVSEPLEFNRYLPSVPVADPGQPGWVQPFDDSPYDDFVVGLDSYLNLISRAERSVDIFSPYLILDARTVGTLLMVARSGVRIRIVVPHIGDSWAVHEVTRSYYDVLTSGGVEIYEYTPGYMHAKVVVADESTAVVGTINFDYRSFYLHQECGVWLHEVPAIKDIMADIDATISVSTPITADQLRTVPWWRRGTRAVLRTFAPMM